TPHSHALQVFSCPDPETEAVMAAREILRFVHAGGRFRDTAVLVRSLPAYERVLARVFQRYGIGFFIDHREPLSHHPLAELTRYAEPLNTTQRQPTGTELAASIRGLWDELGVAETIQKWSEATTSQTPAGTSSRDSVVQAEIHAQAIQLMEQWLDNLELAFENN